MVNIKTQIKAEPFPHNLRSASTAAGFSPPPAGTFTNTSSARSDNHRALRSGAPSIDTRIVEEDAGDDVVFMEIRPAGSSSSQRPGRQSARPRPQQQQQARQMEPQNPSTMGPISHLQDLGAGVAEINELLGNLQNLGISRVTHLPELVLVGDQSAGKSSLMSALAGLPLPRDTGTCTRCPLHIRISGAATEWSCKVSLHRNWDFCPKSPDRPISSHDVTQKDPFPPWVPNIRPPVEFKVIKDKNGPKEIENVLRMAQLAILNPSKHYTTFAKELTPNEAHDYEFSKREQEAEAQFSPNHVSLEVTGPQLAELSFYDLPGIIAAAGRAASEFLEKVVANLASEYIKRPSAVILWAVPMNNDPECNTSWNVVAKLKAQDRCVGVMTKADLLQENNSKRWLDILKGGPGASHQVGQGYFITCRSPPENPTESWDRQNAAEEAFFNHMSPRKWPKEFDEFKHLCGVDRLKNFLSLKLASDFSHVLPKVRGDIQARLNRVKIDLGQLPDKPPNPEMKVITSLTKFSMGIKTALESQEFTNLWNERANAFSVWILDQKPKYIMKSPEIRRLRPNGPDRPIVLDDIKEDSASQASGSPTIRPHRGSRTIGSTGRRSRSASPKQLPFIIRVSRTDYVRPVSKSLTDFRRIRNNYAAVGQPDVTKPQMYNALCIETIQPWKHGMKSLVDATIACLKQRIMGTLEESFYELQNRAVYRESQAHLEDFINQRHKELSGQLELIYTLESKAQFTKSNAINKLHAEKEREVLARARHIWRWKAYKGEEETRIKTYDELSLEERAAEHKERPKQAEILGPDDYSEEITVMAYVRGYYITAAHRFIDVVCMHICSGLFPGLINDLEHYLPQKLGIATAGDQPLDENVWGRLMAEEDEVARRREALQTEKASLEQAFESIVQQEKKLQSHTPSTPMRQSVANDDDIKDNMMQGVLSHSSASVHGGDDLSNDEA